MTRDRLYFLLLNIGHFLDHLFMLIFATVAALALTREWGVGYAELLAYATPGFFAFGIFALPAGWLADKWSRDGMMALFFVGIGLAAIATGFAVTPLQVGAGLFVIGMFAAIYHPVGLAIVSMQWRNTGMRIAVNGVWGNLGVASAALITGIMIDAGGWRLAFIVPGLFSVMLGCVYLALRWDQIGQDRRRDREGEAGAPVQAMGLDRRVLLRISAIVFLTTAVTSIIFQSTTFALPKIFAERMQGLAADLAWFADTAASGPEAVASMIGALAFIVFAVASFAQVLVGSMLDRFGPRPVFLSVAALQVVFFALMPGLSDELAFFAALGFMLGAFGQIPINDFMISKLASGANRARIYAVRFVVAFTVLALTLPMVAFVYDVWGFDTLFRILAVAALVTLGAVAMLPRRLPAPEAKPLAAE